jgi:hypothetical protein
LSVSGLTICRSSGSALPPHGWRIPDTLFSLIVPSNQTPEQLIDHHEALAAADPPLARE